MRKLTSSFLYALVLTTAFSCKSVKNLVNREFPPLSVTDQQYASVERNLTTIDSLKPHVGAFIDKDVVLEYLPAEIKKAVDSARDENVVIHKIDPVISFERQGIFIQSDFHIGIPEQHVEIRGRFNGATAVSTHGDSLFLSSALSSLKISDIRFTKKPGIGKRALAKLLVPVLKHYIENINGKIFQKPVVVDMAWGKAYELDIKKLFAGPDTQIETMPVTVARYTRQSAVRIDTSGITLMVELAKEKEPAPAAGQATPMLQQHSKEELARIFKTFSERYNQRWLSVFDSLDRNIAFTAAVSKAEIAALFNEALVNPITVRQKVALPAAEFNKKVEVKRGAIDCQAVRTSFKYPDFHGASCNWDCMHTITVGICPACRRVRVEDPVCAATRRACRLRVEAERLAWQAARETARIAHQAENEAKVAACNLIREATDFMALGRFKGDVSGSAAGQLRIHNFRFSDDLSRLSLNYSGKLDARLVSDLEMQPVDLGHVFLCYANYSKKTSSDLHVSIPEGTLNLDLAASRAGNSLRLDARISPIAYSATINPSPLHALLADPRFVLECPIFSTIVGVGSVGTMVGNFLDIIKLAPEQELLLKGSVKGDYKLSAVGTSFQPIKFTINGGPERTTEVFWNARSIQFASLKQPARVAVR